MDFVSQMQSAANGNKQPSHADVTINEEEKKESVVIDNQMDEEASLFSQTASENEKEPEPAVIESSEGYRKQQMEQIFHAQGYLKTSDIAEYLGCSPQMARNYVNDFDEFLSVEKTSGGHRKYTLEDAAKLYDIIRIRREKNFTVEMTREYMRTPNGKIMTAGSETAKMEMLFEKLSDEIQRQVKESLEGAVKNSLGDLKESLDRYSSLVLEQKEQTPALEQKKEMDEILKKLDEQTEHNEFLKKELEEKNKQIMRLIEEQDATLKKLEETQKEPAKKKGFLFWKN